MWIECVCLFVCLCICLLDAERQNRAALLAQTETSDSEDRPSTSGLNSHAEGELEEPSLADLERDLNEILNGS